MKISNNYKGKIIIGIAAFIMLLLILSGAILSVPKMQKADAAQPEEFDFYIKTKKGGYEHVPLEDISTVLRGTNTQFLDIEIYASAKNATSYNAAVITGSLWYDKSIFTINTSGAVDSAMRYDDDAEDDVADWDTTSYGVFEDTPISQIALTIMDNSKGNVVIEKDQLLCTVKLKVINADALAVTNSEIVFNFDSTYNPGQTHIARDDGDLDYYYYYNSVASEDWSNITCTPLYLGDLPGSEPTADLKELSLKDNGNTTQYIVESFAPEVTDYTTWQIAYADSVNGMALSYAKASSSSVANVSFSEGSLAEIDENNIITGLADGDEIIISLSDNEGAITKTYTITASVVAISTNANLESIIAKTGTTNVAFDEEFNVDTLNYTLNIPYSKYDVTLIASKAAALATLKIDNELVTSKTFSNLPVGTTNITIEVTAEDGTVKTYTVSIVRATASTNVALAGIKVNNNDVEMGAGTSFQHTIEESKATYLFSIIAAEPSLQKLEYSIESAPYVIMQSGGTSGTARGITKNQTINVKIKVTAEDTTVTEIYDLNITRSASTNTELEVLKVQSEDIVKTLTAIANVYTYNIIANSKQITVIATPKANENATVRILDSLGNEVVDGIIDISSIAAGTYAYSVEVTPQDSSAAVKTYALNIVKKSSAKELDMPTITHTDNAGADITGVTYDEGTSTYTLSMPYAIDANIVNNIRMQFTASANSTITCVGWASLKTGTSLGDGIPLSYADNTFNTVARSEIFRDIIVTAEDGSTKIFNIRFTRQAADTDNYLSSLSVGEVSIEGFEKDILNYTKVIIFEGSTESVNVFGEKVSEYAKVTYNGETSGQIVLTRGVVTTVSINVMAQSGESRIYTIKVVAANDDYSITNIELQKTDTTTIPGLSFDAHNVGPYNITVPYTQEVVNLKVTTPTGANSVVVGGGTKTLSVGYNSYEIYATSEAGTKGLVYAINITRNGARSEKILESLTISSGGTTPVANYITSFSSSIYNYNIRVDRDVSSLKVEATVPVDNGSKITAGLTSSFTWATGSATITVEVTAEDGTKQNYTISVTRANDNNIINDIDVIDGQTVEFSDATITYNLNPVAFSQDKINFAVLLDDATYAKLWIVVNGGSEIEKTNPENFTVDLKTGVNTINIYAKSDFGTKGTTYKFNITRKAASTNANLSELSVLAAGNELLIGDNQFSPDTILYELRVNNTVNSITIAATPEFEKATYSISPTSTILNLGDNIFTLTVKAEDNLTTKEYVVKIKRANDVNEISNIQIKNQTAIYDKDTIVYELDAVGYSTNYITFNVTLLDTSAKLWVKINGGIYKPETLPADFNTALELGENTISIYAVSEFGTQGKIYEYSIVRNAPSSNAKLSALSVVAGGIDLMEGVFDPNTTLYKFRVDNNVPTVEFMTTTQDSKASVTITPSNYNLSLGLNTYYVAVTAEDTTSKLTYQIEIKKANDVNDIEDVQISSKVVNFDKETINYSLGDVEFSVVNLNLGVMLKDTSAKLYVKLNTSEVKAIVNPTDFDLTLASGLNTIKIYAISEFGTKGTEYTFTVTKKVAGNNSKLSQLEVLVGINNILIDENAFDASKLVYTLRVDNNVPNIAINATSQDIKATISYTPDTFTLNSGLNTFYVIVTAEDTTTKTTYTINITKANNNNTILGIDNNVEELEYDQATLSYAMQKVAFSVKTITFNVNLEDASAKLYTRLNGKTVTQTDPSEFVITLASGTNTIVIYAESEFGTLGQEYTFTVTQDTANNDTSLLSLTAVVGEENLLVGDNAFNKDLKEYNVRVNDTVPSIKITAIPTFEYAEITITPAITGLSSGKNTFHIQVKAESGAVDTYTINVYRANDNNNITKISVDGIAVELDSTKPIVIPSFPYSKNSISITADREDQLAKIYGTGSKNIVDGEQLFEVYAISQYGELTGVTKDDVTVYTLKVTRIPVQTDKTLDSLNITDGDGTPLVFDNGITFDKLRTSYTITLDVNSQITEIVINAVAAINSKVLSGQKGRHTLYVKENGTISEQFVLTVTAENGTSQNYTINIVKGTSISNDASIYSVSAKDAANNEYMSFNPNVAKQSDINLPFTVSGLTLTVTPTDNKAKVSGTTGYIAVNAGSSSYVQFKIIAEDGTESAFTYNFSIIRAAAKTDSYLETLTIKDINDNTIDFMDGIFNKDTTTYDIRVDDNVGSVVVSATVPDGNGSKIISSIKPSYALTSSAVTTIIIIVQAENGDSNIYTVNVKRANNDNAIESITIGDTVVLVADFTLVGTSYEYTVKPNFINKVTTLEIAVALVNDESKATVTGAGTKSLQEGLNSFIIYATAQDGTVGANYVVRVNREIPSSDTTLKNLKITSNGNNVLLDTTDVLDNYNRLLGRDTETITIEATKNHQGASVSGDIGTFSVIGGIVNVFKIYVIAENGTSKTYIINVDIKDGKNGITDINTEIATLDFSKETVGYDLGTVVYSVDKIDFNVSLDSEYSKLYLNSAYVTNINAINAALIVGKNIFDFYAESESGNPGKHYLVTITRTAADTNNYLSSLIVKDGNGNPLTFTEGVFNRAVQKYSISLNANSTTTYVVIDAVAENGSVPSGTGVKQLSAVGGVISNDFTVAVTAESGDVRNYVVTVVKSQQVEDSADFAITDISLIGKGQEYLKTVFQPEFAEQDPITIPYDVDSVYLSITASSKATVTGIGFYSIVEGETITINFQVTAQNGTKGLLYTLYVTREVAQTENELEDLYVEVDGERTYLNTLLDSFTINVNNTTTSIVIGGTGPESAQVTGLGTVDLINNITYKVVSVKAQNGDTKTYVLNIVKQSDDAIIKSIQLDGEEILPAFVGNLYTKTVAYAKDRIAILAISNDAKATITGNDSYSLDVGINEFVVYATSQAGNKGEEYTIRITRQVADTNNNLGNLIVIDNATGNSLLLQPLFESPITKYTIDLTDFPDVNEIRITAVSQSAKAKSVEGTGVFTLKTALGESSEIFSITVTAENGSKKVYSITVIRNVKPEDDISVNTVSFVGSDGINYLGTAQDALTKFELGTKKYTITIPYSVDNANLTIINNNGATVHGNGNYVLNSNKIVEFRIISQSGNYTSDTYVIEVIKELPSNDSTLSNLTVDGVQIEGFDPEITSYEMSVAFEDISFFNIGATANDEKAKVIGDLGRISLSSGVNTVNITVTAEDGSSQTYSIVVSRLSKDNTLLSLSVENYTITPNFDVNELTYTLEVPFTVPTVNVLAVANSKATITGTGHKALSAGENIIEVYVTSEQGIKGETYTLVVTKIGASSDNSLKSLEVFSGVDGQAIALEPTFRPDVYEYIINLAKDSNINSLNIEAEANCPFAITGNTGYKVLKTTLDGLYNNIFEVTVLAQDMSTKTYTISVYRDVELADDITIGELSLRGSDGVNYLGNNGGIETFLPSVYTYNIVVPYYVESITLQVQTLTATCYGTGQKMFDDSNRLVFTTYLVSQSGKIVSNNYSITVNRTMPKNDNTLKSIRVNGVQVKGFDPAIKMYEIDIPYLTTQKVIISADPTSPTADVINGVGTFNLKEGRNVFSILVRAENGDTDSYNLVINYMNTNSLLDNLSLEGSLESFVNEENAVAYPFTFIPDTLSYVVTVDKGIKTVNLKGQAQDQDRAAIIGLGKYTLNNDRTTIVVNVIAADNETTSTYTVNVIKTVLPSSNTRLKDLSVGGYNLAFNPTELDYSLNVNSGTGIIDINAIPEDPNAKVSIVGNTRLESGQNVVLVQVEAEDGSKSFYQLKVNKPMEQDYFLTIMLILIFLLLLIVLLTKLISSNKEKGPKRNFKGFKLNNNNNPIDLNNIGEETKKWKTS